MGKNSFFSSNLFINTRGKLLDLRSPCIMSILNLTPDSFYDGGSNSNADRLLKKAETDLSSGAGILDLGAWSSRPGSIPISVAQEWARLEPALKSIRKNFPDAIISIDTYRAEIVTMAAAEGADMINDISAGNLDENMLESVANSGLPYVLMHMRGNSLTMTELNDYDDLLTDISKFFRDTLEIVRQAGITDIILDPGIGFSKKMNQSFELLARLTELKLFDLPILVGLSRKSMIAKLLNTDTAHALNGTTAAHMIALENKASILRVHDVKEAAEAIKIFKTCKQFSA